MEIRKQVLGEKHPFYATCLNDLAFLYKLRGEYDRAEPLYREALQIRKQTLGEKHPSYAASLNDLAMLCLTKNQPREAVRMSAQAVEIMRHLMDSTADVQSERQQLAMNQTMRWYLDNFLSASAAAKSPGDEAYSAVFAWKGAVTARLAIRDRATTYSAESGVWNDDDYAKCCQHEPHITDQGLKELARLPR